MQPPESVAAILFSPDRSAVLLIQRRDVPVWVLPGGGVEADELAETATIREVQEETGFTVNIKRLVGVYTPINRLTRLTHLYECEILGGDATLSAETKGVQFFPLNDLPKLIPPPYREWIAEGAKEAGPVYRALTSVTYWILFKNLILHPTLVLRFLLARMGMPINH